MFSPNVLSDFYNDKSVLLQNIFVLPRCFLLSYISQPISHNPSLTVIKQEKYRFQPDGFINVTNRSEMSPLERSSRCGRIF
jgi:hypothetical protein